MRSEAAKLAYLFSECQWWNWIRPTSYCIYTYGNELTTGTWAGGCQTYKDGFGKPWVLVYQCLSVKHNTIKSSVSAAKIEPSCRSAPHSAISVVWYVRQW